jgi:hypothetical protein
MRKNDIKVSLAFLSAMISCFIKHLSGTTLALLVKLLGEPKLKKNSVPVKRSCTKHVLNKELVMLASGRPDGRPRMLARFPAPVSRAFSFHVPMQSPRRPDVSRVALPHMRTVCPLGGTPVAAAGGCGKVGLIQHM